MMAYYIQFCFVVVNNFVKSLNDGCSYNRLCIQREKRRTSDDDGTVSVVFHAKKILGDRHGLSL